MTDEKKTDTQKRIRKGRIILLLFIIALIIFDTGTIITKTLSSGFYLTGWIRLVLSLILYYFLYMGKKWARYLTASLLSIAGVLLLLAAANMAAARPILPLIIFGIISLYAAFALLFSRSISAYFAFRNTKNS